MNRRNFLKTLSAIPLIGLPVKLLAKKEFIDPVEEVERKVAELSINSKDPYEQIFREEARNNGGRVGYSKTWNTAENLNLTWKS